MTRRPTRPSTRRRALPRRPPSARSRCGRARVVRATSGSAAKGTKIRVLLRPRCSGVHWPTLPPIAAGRMSIVKLVGVVLVSHSSKLAEGLADLVRELGGDQVPVIAAGGMDDGSLGTSYGRIEQAVSEADQGAGVLLLGDLGSSLLTV